MAHVWLYERFFKQRERRKEMTKIETLAARPVEPAAAYDNAQLSEVATLVDEPNNARN
jgi:hypothetical protein